VGRNCIDCGWAGLLRRRRWTTGVRRCAHGKHLWNFNMGQMLTASPITYSVDGKQYVTIAARHVSVYIWVIRTC